MKSSYIAVVLVVLVVVGGGAYALSSMQKTSRDAEGTMMDKAKDAAMMQEEAMKKDVGMMQDGDMKKEDTMMQKDDAMMKKGSYEAYSPEKFALADKGHVVLFFRASWCPTCRALDTDIKANLNAVPSGVTILDVDYDKSTELKKKYGVTMQHTLVEVDAQGNLIKKWTGSPTLAALITEVK